MDLGLRCIQPGNVKAAIFRKSQETEYDLSDVSRRDAGQDFEGIILVVGVPGAIGQGIHSLKVARPFAGMAVLSEEFGKTLVAVRSVGIAPHEAKKLVRLVTGWPQLPEKPKPWENDEQAKLDADLETRRTWLSRLAAGRCGSVSLPLPIHDSPSALLLP